MPGQPSRAASEDAQSAISYYNRELLWMKNTDISGGISIEISFGKCHFPITLLAAKMVE